MSDEPKERQRYVIISGNGDYTCVHKQQARDSRVNIHPRQAALAHAGAPETPPKGEDP